MSIIQTTERQTDVQRDYAVRMTQVLQQFASMLVGRKVGVRLSDKTIAPAWSTHNTIEFCESTLPDLTKVEGVLSVRGLSFHELAHILFTPRTQSDIHRWVVDNGHWQAYNALEDQRIETLLVAQYQAIAPWLTATIAQYLLDNPQAVAKSFPLIRGRKYLPVEVRAFAKQAYADQANIQELADIIDEYRLLVFPSDTEQAKPLIARFAELVQNLQQQHGDGLADPNGHDNRPTEAHQSTIKDKPASKREQEQARDKAKAQDAETEDEFDWAGDAQPDSPADDQPSDEESTDSDSTEDESADTDSDSQSDDADQPSDESADIESDTDTESDSDSDSDDDGQTDKPAPTAGTEAKPESIGEQVLQDIINDIKESLGQTLADDIAKFGGDVVLDGVQVAQPRQARTTPELPSGEAVQASVEFRTELERIKAQYDPAWEFKTRRGRLNAVRYAKGYDIDELFDKFEYGRDDAVDIEAVILLDTSGSMGREARRAFESAWGIKRALDAVGASCSVISFDTSCETLYGADEPASTTIKVADLGGGTSPLAGLQFANYQLAVSDRKTKILFAITDGQWADAERADNIIQNLRDGGVLTALAYIETGAGIKTIDQVDAHKCEAIAHVNSASDIAHVGRAVVNLAIERNLVSA